jgi:eukaryotic-like serine/threonine-protein kinase
MATGDRGGDDDAREKLAFDDTAHSDDHAEARPQSVVSGDDETIEGAMAPITGSTLGDDDGGREPGMTLGASLVLERPLGRGGMGSVWVARHLKLDTEVAVKFIADRLIDRGDTAAKRFEREARLAAKMKSPHAVQIFDHGTTDDGTPYIVMELLHGESLAERLDRGPLSVVEASRVVQQVAEVLREAHNVGVVHRDIKPHNLFLTNTSYDIFTKVLDFGVARHEQVDEASAVTETGALVGTPFYMSPEQLLRAEEPGRASDLWALAVVAYQCLTTKLPFHGDTIAALGAALSNGDFEPVTSRRASLPNTLDTWFSRTLSSDSSDRFADVATMADDFAAACGTPRPSYAGLGSDSADAIARDSGAPAKSTSGAAATFDGSSSNVGARRRGANRIVIGIGVGTAAIVALAFGLSDPPKPVAPVPSARPSVTADATATTPESPSPLPSAPPPTEPPPTEPSAASASASATVATPVPRRKRPAVPHIIPTADVTAEPAAADRPAWCDDPKLAFERDPQGYTRLKKACR